MGINYSVRGFRSEMKEALDKVESGEEVLIERHGVFFAVRLADDTANKAVSFSKNESGVYTKDDKFQPPEGIVREIARDREILKEINTLQAAINGADPMNQDPDYWDSIHEKEKQVQELWGEWHAETGQ